MIQLNWITNALCNCFSTIPRSKQPLYVNNNRTNIYLIVSNRSINTTKNGVLFPHTECSGYYRTVTVDTLTAAVCDYVCFSALLSTTSTQFRRHYFGTIKINSMQVSLSVLTSSSLSSDLKAVKQSLRFPLIRFEDAKVELGMCHYKLSLSSNRFLYYCLLSRTNM